MTKGIIPFGKYKDQPIEVLHSDPTYTEWLTAQSWLKERYPELFTIIVNNFQEPSDTPEHNAMHVKFLNDEYVYRLLSPVVCFPDSGQVAGKKFEADGWDVFVALSNSHADLVQLAVKAEADLIEKYQNVADKSWEAVQKEIKSLWENIKSAGFYVELKPTISDDFPAVLRQMKATKKARAKNCDIVKTVLLVGEYTGIGATQDEFVAFMQNEGIVVLFAE